MTDSDTVRKTACGLHAAACRQAQLGPTAVSLILELRHNINCVLSCVPQSHERNEAGTDPLCWSHERTEAGTELGDRPWRGRAPLALSRGKGEHEREVSSCFNCPNSPEDTDTLAVSWDRDILKPNLLCFVFVISLFPIYPPFSCSRAHCIYYTLTLHQAL